MCWTGGGNHCRARLGFKIPQKVWRPADAALSKNMSKRKGRSKDSSGFQGVLRIIIPAWMARLDVFIAEAIFSAWAI
jgi:hypothetical protein